jgi:uncharacterized protein HemY
MSVVARRYFLRGQTALERGEWEPAMEAFRSAVELAPNFAMARIGFAIALASEGDCPRAAQSLRAGLARPTSEVTRAAMWATLGDILTRSGDFLGAEDAFKQAALTPGFEVRAASGLARVYGKTGRYTEAVGQLQQAARISAHS